MVERGKGPTPLSWEVAEVKEGDPIYGWLPLRLVSLYPKLGSQPRVAEPGTGASIASGHEEQWGFCPMWRGRGCWKPRHPFKGPTAKYHLQPVTLGYSGGRAVGTGVA